MSIHKYIFESALVHKVGHVVFVIHDILYIIVFNTTSPMVPFRAHDINSSVVILQDGVVGKEARCPSQQGEVSNAKTFTQISNEDFTP